MIIHDMSSIATVYAMSCWDLLWVNDDQFVWGLASQVLSIWWEINSYKEFVEKPVHIMSTNHSEITRNHSKPYSIKVLCQYGSFLECSCWRRCVAHEEHLDEPWKHGPWKAWLLHVGVLNSRTLIIHWGCTSAFHDVSMLHKLDEGSLESEAEMDDNWNLWLLCKSCTLCTCLFFPKGVDVCEKLEAATT